MPLEALLRRMVDTHASDLHLKSGSPPGYRVNGDIVPHADHPILTKHETRAFVEEVLNPEQLKAFDESGDYDLSKAIPGLARFRVNCNRQRAACGLVIRIIPEQVPQLEQLATPPIFKKLCRIAARPSLGDRADRLGEVDDARRDDRSHQSHRGGAHPNNGGPDRVRARRSQVFRESARGRARHGELLRGAAPRAAPGPDVILVGEMRDLETISLAITAAETGHLVFGTLHTTSAIQTVDRIIDVFPHEAQQQVRMQLSMALAGVISQTLVPKVSGARRDPRDPDRNRRRARLHPRGKTHMLLNMLQTGTKDGMQTLEQGMAEGVKKGLITFDAGIMRVNNPNFSGRCSRARGRRGAGKGGNGAHAPAASAHGAPAHSAPHAAPPHAVPPHLAAPPRRPPPAVPGAAPASPPPPRAPARSFPQPPCRRSRRRARRRACQRPGLCPMRHQAGSGPPVRRLSGLCRATRASTTSRSSDALSRSRAQSRESRGG